MNRHQKPEPYAMVGTTAFVQSMNPTACLELATNLNSSLANMPGNLPFSN